jgi:hypothetical protein
MEGVKRRLYVRCRGGKGSRGVVRRVGACAETN